MGTKTKFIILTLLLVADLIAQSDNLRFQKNSVSEGLSNNSVYSIYQDSEGYMWFGTEYGLNRYDGYSFKQFFADPENPFSISDNFIWDIYEDEYGIIWIATNYGLNRFDRYTLQFTHYFHDPEDSATLSNNYIRVIYEDRQGILWFGSIDGLNKYNRDNDNFVRYSFGQNFSHGFGKNYILDIFEDSEGSMWIGAADGGLNKFDRSTGSYKHYFCENRKDDVLTNLEDKPLSDKELSINNFNSSLNHSIRTIAEDKNGIMWLGTWGHGVVKFDKVNECISIPDNIPGIKYVNCQDILVTKAGEIWLGVDQTLVNYNNELDFYSFYRHDPYDRSSISDNISIAKIYEDRTGNIWIGCTSGGINKISKEKRNFNQYNYRPQDSSSLNNKIVSAIYMDHAGLLWLGTYGGGLNCYDQLNNKYRSYPVHDTERGMWLNQVISILEDCTNTLWIGSAYCGLWKFNGKEEEYKRVYPNINADNFNAVRGINVMCEDDNCNIWLGTDRGGLLKYDKNNDNITTYVPDENNTNSISSIQIHAIIKSSFGDLWIGTSKGLNKFSINSGQFTRYIYKSDNIFNRDNNVIYSLYEDRFGNIWMGTASGLAKFDTATESFTYFTEQDGFTNIRIYGMQGDDKDNIWLNTAGGLIKFNIIDGIAKNYSYAADLHADAFSIGANFKSSTGQMYFGGSNGFTIFHPDSIKDNPFPPQLVITDLQIFNKSVLSEKDSIYTYSLLANNNITLSYDQNVFSIHFAALHFSAPEKNEYAYILEGYDKDWYDIGNRRFVTFTGLPSGEYVFKVKASNCDGIWNNTGLAVNLIITPPFWDTWWFRLIILLTISLSVYSIFRTRLANQKKIEKIRIKIANDLHDEIGSNLGSITMLSSMLKNNNLPKEKKDKYLDTIFNTTKKAAESMRDIIWFINPENNDAEKIILRMKDFVSKILVNINYEFNIVNEPYTDKLALNVKRNIYLILKESLHNIVKHSSADFVTITMKKENNIFKLIIIDNGVGFITETSNLGIGISSMKKRAEEIGGSFIINSMLKNGTESELRIDL